MLLDDRVGVVLAAFHFDHGLLLGRIEALSQRRDRVDAVAGQGVEKAFPDHIDAFEERVAVAAPFGVVEGALEVVQNREQVPDQALVAVADRVRLVPPGALFVVFYIRGLTQQAVVIFLGLERFGLELPAQLVDYILLGLLGRLVARGRKFFVFFFHDDFFR